jgi:hypothetical protein
VAVKAFKGRTLKLINSYRQRRKKNSFTTLNARPEVIFQKQFSSPFKLAGDYAFKHLFIFALAS